MTQDQKQITVTRTIDAPAKDIFALLSLPAKHTELDGSGMLRGSVDTERITKTGQVFVMNMHAEAMGGDYRMHNHVSAFDENKMIGWTPAQEENKTEPAGWEWLWELRPVDADTTEVTLTYDWSRVEDKQLLPLFPVVDEEQLQESLNRLAAAVSGS
ncbi:polyketide cyclase [Brachybacterium sp. EF45031]|uniref:SRPBCC family protein n=1 Tax=Brachybacterium sillae TaxID=2810536 RepID=UPI00217DE6D3|nr:SRPBCC family protein [Brachybacterium sillae]MCS6711537.1 polyketide cyclase [Brachybacterium sillae]